MKKARVIVTLQCPRMCDGCCNTNTDIMQVAKRTNTLQTFADYDDVVITGGEPLAQGDHALAIVRELSRICKDTTRLFLYTSMYSTTLPHIMPYLTGIKYTWHHTRVPKDVKWLVQMYELMCEWPLCSRRVAIDSRFDRHWGMLVDKKVWDSVEFIEWRPDGYCPLPDGEELWVYTGTPREE